jgi:histidinol-phosphate phosphatase family protein
VSGLAYSIVVPTIGRPSLGRLLAAVANGLAGSPAAGTAVDPTTGPGAGLIAEPTQGLVAGALRPAAVLVVDDRPDQRSPLRLDAGPVLAPLLSLLPGPARGPAAARNVGWQSAGTPWVVFVDDDVLPPPGWPALLVSDLAAAAADVGGSQGRVEVPLPAQRRPTDWERCTAGLATAQWATADMAYRRDALAAVGGFDERFRRAYREDADLAVRVRAAGWRLTRGRRWVSHPPRPASRWASVAAQAGNADDVLMRRLHGHRWRELADAPPGRLRRHVTVTAAGLVGLAGAAGAAGARLADPVRRPRPVSRVGGSAGLRARSASRHGTARPARPARWFAVAGAAGWLAGTAEFAAARIRPGPRTAGEVGTMLLTSVAIPPAAVTHWWRGRLSHPRRPAPWAAAPLAVLFDRDGTLIQDVPYNSDPALVAPMPGAAAAVAELRASGVPLAVVTNQSAVARGLASAGAVRRVNAAVDRLLGPFGSWQVCPHAPDGGCGCRKPAPGLVYAAAAALGMPVRRCVVVGDIGTDVAAARAAGARAVLVPTAATRPEEVTAARGTPGCAVAADLPAAVRLILAGRPAPAERSGAWR